MSRAINPGYHELISEFEKITGVGALLNTSFNLHGEPIVESPLDALNTLRRSGLHHLSMGTWLVSKVSVDTAAETAAVSSAGVQE